MSLSELLERKLRKPSGPLRVWELLRERLNPALYRPKGEPQVEAHPVQDPRRPPYLVLKHPQNLAYVRLSKEEAFLWRLMDGSRSVKDLVIAYFTEFGSLALGRVAGLVGHLRQVHFLTDKPSDILGRLRFRLARRRVPRWITAVMETLLGRLFVLRGVDPWIDRLHRGGGWVLYSRPMLLLYLVVCAVGGALFVLHARSGEYNALRAAASSVRGVAFLFMLNYVALFVHELAHALTCRHYGAKVNGAGFLFYLGIPAFFVDTTDIWTKPLRARLATSWAGPYSGLILAGLLSIVIALFPRMQAAAALHQLAFNWMLLLIFNLIPFVELDGYYMLVDWLDMPRLRATALEFVRRPLWRKVWRREPFTPKERLLAGFGLLAVVVTFFLILIGIGFWQAWLGVVFGQLWRAGSVGRLLIIPLAFVLIVPLLVTLIVSLVRQTRTGAQRVRQWWIRPRPLTIRDRQALLSRVAFLSALPREAREDVARRLHPLRRRAGQEIFHQGDFGDAFYIVRRGHAEVLQQREGVEQRVVLLGPGDHFGEIALLEQVPRTATVRALTPLEVLGLRKGDFERLLAPHVAATEVAEVAIRQSENLRANPFFAALSSSEIEVLTGRLRRDRFSAGAVVVRQGEAGDRFYILQEGQAEAVVEAEGRQRRVNVLGQGSYFGEIALLMDVPRTATVRALTPLVTFSLERTDFEAFLQSVLPTLMSAATDRLARGGIEPE